MKLDIVQVVALVLSIGCGACISDSQVESQDAHGDLVEHGGDVFDTERNSDDIAQDDSDTEDSNSDAVDSAVLDSHDGDSAVDGHPDATSCPSFASSCPEACMPWRGAEYDSERGCLKDSEIIGCHANRATQPAATCVKKKAGDQLFFSASVSILADPNWVECSDTEESTVLAAPRCEP